MILQKQQESLRETDTLLHNLTSNTDDVNVSMNGIRDIFSNAFGNGSMFNSNSIGSSNNSNNVNNGAQSNQYGEMNLATNLTETNNGLAMQSNLVDEIFALKQKELQPDKNHRNFFPMNAANSVAKKPPLVVPDDVISDLSRRVSNMSMTERQEAQNDICGFRSRQQNEDPLELSIWMNAMDDLLRKGISGNDKRFLALRIAMHMEEGGANVGVRMPNINNNSSSNTTSGAEYIRSQQLKFLRASKWSVEEAVFRMALFFELKLEQFGSECLIRDLTMKDLMPTDIELWKRYGFVQLSEERDTYGRAILVFLGKQQFHLPVGTVVRCLLYLSMIMIRDESIQLNGTAFLFWGIGQDYIISGRSRQLVQVFKALPIRGISRHICYNADGVQDLFQVIAQVSQTWGIVRFKVHRGTTLECCYNLMTYGMPRNAIPISNEGEVELDFHRIFLNAVERKEADDLKRRRQKRLDIQIQQLQMQNQISYNSSSSSSNNNNIRTLGGSWGDQGIGERHQNLSMPEEDNWNMSGLSSQDIMTLRSEDFEGLPDDFMKRRSETGSGMTGISTSTTNTQKKQTNSSSSSFTSQPRPNQSQSDKTIPIASTSIPPVTLPNSTDKNQTPEATTSTLPRRITDRTKSDAFIVIPDIADVIMGRGRHNKKKPGNRKLNQLLETYQDEYEASDKFQKTVLSEVVVSKMVEDGSRFLIREGEKKNGVWVEVSLEKARDKVAHDFRNLRRNAKIAKKNAAMTASDISLGPSSISSHNDFGAPKRQRSLVNVMEGENDSKNLKSSMAI